MREAEWDELQAYRQRSEGPGRMVETVRDPPPEPEVVAQRALIEQLRQRVRELEFEGAPGGGARRACARSS